MHVNTLISSLRAYNVHTLTLHMVATPLTCDHTPHLVFLDKEAGPSQWPHLSHVTTPLTCDHTPHLVFLDKEAYALQVLPNVLCAQKSLHLFGPGELILR